MNKTLFHSSIKIKYLSCTSEKYISIHFEAFKFYNSFLVCFLVLITVIGLVGQHPSTLYWPAANAAKACMCLSLILFYFVIMPRYSNYPLNIQELDLVQQITATETRDTSK